ncbi:unnamed protein product [Lymnaea stagnalis]|uniref:VPS9 domain-containing protein n=1 Tax=Lymnaea stagnalis TaxID=6523 RepID=A0AAV2IID1_LYMST
METSLPSLMKEVGEALKLDNESKDKEAYKKYVSCIYKIATNLVLAMKLAGGDVVVDHKTCRQVKLVQQCVDRVAELVKKMDTQKIKPSSVCIGKSTSYHSSDLTSLTSVPPRSLQEPQSPLFPPVIQQTTPSTRQLNAIMPTLPPENNPYVFTVQRTRVLTPMEIAQKQNQSLMTAYRARMNRLNRSDFNAFNYSLTIQRKMAENIAIAQAQEEELARKMQARNQRLEDEAAKRFATPIGMSKEEQEQRQIYKKILAYENEAKWLQNWRNKLESNPEDPILISQLVAEILRCADHPLTELLRKYQVKIYDRLYPLVANKHAELEQIKVPFLKTAWPSLDDVADIINTTVFSYPSPTETREQTLPLSDNQSSQEDCTDGPAETDTITNSHNDFKNDKIQSGDIGPDSWSDPLCVRSPSQEFTENVIAEKKENQTNTLNDTSDVLNDGSAHSCNEKNQSGEPTYESTVSEDGGQNNLKPFCNSAGQSQLATAVSETKKDLDLALEKGQELTTQLSWERKQAQLLMRQVTRDYSSYKLDKVDFDEDTLDYLFDDDDNDDNSYEDEIFNPKTCNVLKDNSSVLPSVPEKSPLKPPDSTPLDRSVSHQPPASFVCEDDADHYQSLPARLGKDEVDHRKFSELNMDAYERHLKSIAEDIHRYLEKLLVMLTIAYEPLDTPVGKDQCAVSLEEPFFKPIWKTLLRLFRVVYYKQERVLACIMTKYATITPKEMKVSDKLCLVDADGESQPYQAAITELLHVQDYYTMLSKLECVVKVCRLICKCVDDHYCKGIGEKEGKKVPSVGADDLLPILSYVIIKSALPQLSAECYAMTEFIHEGYMMGEEGYCLTTLRTALNFVTSLFPSCL